jgi:acetoacetyl-CoA synthetase
MTGYARFLAERGMVDAFDYHDLWSYSVTHLGEFWSSIADFFDVGLVTPASEILVRGAGVEGAHFFPGARLNYVDQVLRHRASDLAVIAANESGVVSELTYAELAAEVRRVAAGLAGLGVQRGDRVAAVLPNGAAAVVCFLASAFLGAVFSSCAPEFGASSTVDRFAQIDPKVLIAVTSSTYGGKHHDQSDKLDALEAALSSLVATVVVTGAGDRARSEARRAARRLDYETFGAAGLGAGQVPAAPVPVDFEHPLWILYSSGTTGLPKAIVHGHGGILLEHLKAVGLHADLGPGDRFLWFTTTGWMMWNFLLGGLLVGATIVCYDGSPVTPDHGALWRLASRLRVSYFGTSAPFLASCRRAGISPRALADLSSVRTVGSTGAPLAPEDFVWTAAEVGDDVAVASVSGGTDLCTAFLGSCPTLPVYVGELQGPTLGAAVAAFDPSGRPVIETVGELVIREPMPSMPLYLFGDGDGSRLHESYFSTFPGVWRHGDFIKMTRRGSCVIYGRSDATLNRGGVRMGTAEFYRVVEAMPEVNEALVVDTTELGHPGNLVLFVVYNDRADDGTARQDPMKRAEQRRRSLEATIRSELSPRHVPDRIVAVDRLPHTINGKRLEVPIRRILLGAAPSSVLSAGALDDPSALDELLAAIDHPAS